MARRNKRVLVSLGLAVAGLWVNLVVTGAVRAAPQPLVYAQSGDVKARSAVIWGRCNREVDARIIVDVATAPEFDGREQTSIGSQVSADTDYTGSIEVYGLQPDMPYYYRVRCVNEPGRGQGRTEDVGPTGTLRTALDRQQARSVRFVWLADLGGQGWGRNPDLTMKDVEDKDIQGGYVIFEVMRQLEPDFAVFAGDTIYADGPISATKAIPEARGGGTWINDPTKDFVAVTLDEYRANWRYNLGDAKLRQFLLATPIYSQWDDHEVANNWYPGEILTSAPYDGLSADVLAERSRQALFEYNPIQGKTLFRRFQRGKHVELFLLDERSFRGPNTDNSDPNGIEMLGQQQFGWLKRSLKNSRATWKIISTHDPLSLVTGAPDPSLTLARYKILRIFISIRCKGMSMYLGCLFCLFVYVELFRTNLKRSGLRIFPCTINCQTQA